MSLYILKKKTLYVLINFHVFPSPSLDGTGIVRVMYVFFLGVVPFISLSLFFVYYWRQNRPLFLRKSANVYVQKRRHAAANASCLLSNATPSDKVKPIISASTLISSTNPRVWTMGGQIRVDG